MIFRLRTIPNFLCAMWRILWRKLRRQPTHVDPVIAAWRYSTCIHCPSGLYNPATDQCKECTCFCSLKTLYVTESCPKRHWPA